jgi:hypothetical protein
MEYDPKTYSVSLFIKRIEQMSDLYGKQEVLKVLPLCIKGEAIEWYAGLNYATTDRMARHLSVWKDQLRRRFGTDSNDALDAAYRLRFRWEREDHMNLRQYVTRKVMLMEEAGVYDEDHQVRQIWRGLEPNLMATVRPLPAHNTLEGYTEELYQQEYAAKRLWSESKGGTKRADAYRMPENRRVSTADLNRLVERATKPFQSRPNIPAAIIPTEKRLTFPRRRDCRHCGGAHMDFDCPTRRNTSVNRGVKAYLLEPDIPEDERMVKLDEETFHIYERLRAQESEPENGDTDVPKPDSGNGQ